MSRGVGRCLCAIFAARLCASAVLAVALCLSVCLFVTSRSYIKTAERIELVFGKQASLGLSGIRVSPKMGIPL